MADSVKDGPLYAYYVSQGRNPNSFVADLLRDKARKQAAWLGYVAHQRHGTISYRDDLMAALDAKAQLEQFERVSDD